MKNWDLLLEKAIDKNELQKMLIGIGDYSSPSRLAELPSDLTPIFLALNRYRTKIGDEALTNLLTSALLLLLNTSFGTWWCLCIIFSYLFEHKPNTLHFKLDLESLSTPLNEALKKFENDLKKERHWVGYRFENGLYDDVQYMKKKINEQNIKGFRIPD